MRAARPLKALLTICLFLALSAPALPQSRLKLSPIEARDMARSALLAGNAPLTIELARALLERDGDDFAALILLAGAEAALGRNEAALAHARRAFALTRLPEARFDAAMIASRALVAEGHFLRAQLWLRRAHQAAPNRALGAVAARDFRRIDRIKPLQLRTTFALAPSSNVNNGSEAEVVVINGLPFTLSGDARALAGLEATLGLNARRRMGKTAFLGLNLLSRNYRLTPASLALAGGKTGADYAFAAAELDLGWSGSRNGAPSGLLTLGRNFYGGAVLTDYARLQATRNFGRLQGGLAFERQLRRDVASRSAGIGTLSLARGFALGGGQARLRLELRKVASGSAEIAHAAQALRFDYSWNKPLLGARISLSTDLNLRQYDRAFLSPAPRRDTGFGATVSLMLPKYQVMGFAPVIDLSVMRNLSSDDLYDSSRQSISFRLKSAF